MELCYHYCSAETFRLIVESSNVHMSSTHNMNDVGEGEFIRRILLKFLNEISQELRSDDLLNSQDIESLIEKVKKDSEDRYVLCLSQSNDTLSQWRTYADDGKGVSIGFDMSGLGFECDKDNNIPGNVISQFSDKYLNLAKLDYFNELDAISETEYSAKTLVQELRNSKEGKDNRLQLFIAIMSDMLFSTKHHSFSEECEIRLMYNYQYNIIEGNIHHFPNSTVNNSIKFKTRDSYLIPYINLDFSQVKKEFIKEITLGPKNKFHESDLDLFLKINGMAHVKINKSASTYR